MQATPPTLSGSIATRRTTRQFDKGQDVFGAFFSSLSWLARLGCFEWGRRSVGGSVDLKTPTRTLLALLCVMAASQGARADSVGIGLTAPLTGPLAVYGAQVRLGVEQAVEDLNARGGVLKNTLALTSLDDQCLPAMAAEDVRRLVFADKVSLIIGPVCSDAALAADHFLASVQKLVVQVLPTATGPALTDRGRSDVFRMVPPRDREGAVAGEYLQQLQGYNIALLSDKSAYAEDVKGFLRRTWPKMDSELRYQAEFPPNTSDFVPLLMRLRAAEIKVVYVASSPTDLGNLIRQAREQGMQALFVSTSAAESPAVWATAGRSAEGILFTYFPDPRELPSADQIVQRMARANREPSISGLYAYAALQVWAEAADRVGSFDAEKVASALHQEQFKAATGPVSFDKNGDIKDLNYAFYEWHSGRVAQLNHRPPPPPPPPGP